MRFRFLFLLLLLSQLGIAQNFTELPAFAFDGVEYSSIAFADIDNDGDEDVLITGDRGPSPFVNPVTILYESLGDGIFRKVPDTPFEDVEHGAIAFSDIDQDGDQDVMITGERADGSLVATLYVNTFGIFSAVENTPFIGVLYSSIAFADVDGDNYDDLLITGQDKDGLHITRLYINDQVGNFTELPEPLSGIAWGSVAFADVDGDGDQDIFLTGQNNFFAGVAAIYINDGSGVFTESTSSFFEGVFYSSVAFADVDGDNDEDLLITGEVYGVFNPVDIATLYINDGSGVFTAAIDTPFTGVYESAVGFSDVDGDGDEDVLISGETIDAEEITTLYINDGDGNFSVDTDNNFEGVFEGSIGFSDVDFDGDEDVLITGEKNSGLYIAHLYTNDGDGTFQQVKGIPFNDVAKGDDAIADVNGDGALDVLITGELRNEMQFTHLYTNDGIGDFVEMINTPFEEVEDGAVDFADIDGDGDQDLLITGKTSSTFVAELYRNDGLGNYSTIEQNTLEDVHFSAAAFNDIDGDGDADIVITGANTSEAPTANLYLNDGTGNYTLGTAPFEAVSEGGLAFADVDGDGDEDVMITGQNVDEEGVANLYLNDGMGGFIAGSANFTGVTKSDLAFADVDGDGDEDVFIMGREGTSSSNLLSSLYLNDGNGIYAVSDNVDFEGLESGELAFSDVDGDNDLDMLVTGSNDGFFPRTYLYINDGSGVYSLFSDVPFRDLDFSTVVFFDIDGDEDEDVLLTGYDFDFNPITRLYLNDLLSSTEEVSVVQNHKVKIYPNPVTTETVNISLLYTAEKSVGLQIVLMDINGRVLTQQSAAVTTGENVIPFNYSALPKGTYLIKLFDGFTSSHAKLIVH